MLGCWNKSVYITYLGAFLAVTGLLVYYNTSNLNYAFIGMFLAALCDMFDGKVARSIKNRTDLEKNFGIEIDSLADIIAFIVVPSLTLYKIGLNNYYQIIILSLYIICGIIRLAYFNVYMSNKDKAIKEYLGLPVPVSVFIFGLIWLLAKIIPLVSENQIIIYTVLVPIVGYLHISKIKIKKITSNWFYLGVSFLALAIIILGACIL